MTKKQAAKKRGRPALRPDEGKRFPLNMRTTKELRDQLAEAAESSGRSMAQEVEFRLEKSFLTEDYMTLAFGDFKSSLFARSFLDVMKTIEDYMGKSPWEDFEAHTALRAAADEILLGHQPHIPADLEKRIVVWTQRLHGWEKKQKIWEEKGEDGEPPENPGPDPIEKAQIIGRAGVEVVRDGYKNELQKLAEIRTAERAIKIKGPILK